ncbi:PREDICTED: uncharacterized protein LOC104590728 [Nelumbo nucifera]|uniref:Uncharacterized protein LOC104590728 n=1 Tax=Nelumbo nucifera TaxID=4432 RepID=A0A1U7Z9M1_NELNU|nr:PREDICTED: uncharacterized protein LOC104590728 [Nelumbo nucifera]
MADRERTLRELAAPILNQQPLCIEYPTLEVAFELKSGLVQLLLVFHGFPGEDPHKHFKEFHVVCSSMKPQGMIEEQVKLIAFSFTLRDKAKDWLYILPPGSIRTWDEMNRVFLDKYFPASRAANIRKEICGIRQSSDETLYEYWERFKQLCASCPQHQIPEQLLIQYFYEGLQPMDRSMVDADSGGALANKTPEVAWQLISNMVENSQQFGERTDGAIRRVNEVSHSNLESQISDLTFLVRQLAARQLRTTKVCGICSIPGHPTDMCSSVQDESMQQVNAVGGFPGQPQRKYDPYSNYYNPGWRDHPNLSYGNQGGPQRFQPQAFNRQPPIPTLTQAQNQPSSSSMSLDEIVKDLSQLTSQKKVDEEQKEEDEQDPLESSNKVKPDSPLPKISNAIVPPFPSRLEKSNKEEYEQEVLETFRKVEINIPLLDAIKKISKYAKFLNELCTNKRKLRGDEKVRVGENVSAIIKRTLPEKRADPSMLTLPCVIGKKRIEHAMLDLGASINFMQYSIYCALNFGPLKETRVVIQLADHSSTYPEGIVEDVLAPKLEWKILPNHLKYAYLGDEETLPVIIAKGLTDDQEAWLIKVLKEHKAAIGWTLVDIKGVSPSICMHKILLEDGAKPVRESQRNLNPAMKEVVMKEILKLLDEGII